MPVFYELSGPDRRSDDGYWIAIVCLPDHWTASVSRARSLCKNYLRERGREDLIAGMKCKKLRNSAGLIYDNIQTVSQKP